MMPEWIEVNNIEVDLLHMQAQFEREYKRSQFTSRDVFDNVEIITFYVDRDRRFTYGIDGGKTRRHDNAVIKYPNGCTITKELSRCFCVGEIERGHIEASGGTMDYLAWLNSGNEEAE